MAFEQIALAGNALVALAYLPQIYQLIKEKRTDGINLEAWALWLIGSLLILPNALTSDDVAFIILDAVGIVGILIILVLGWYYRKNKHKL